VGAVIALPVDRRLSSLRRPPRWPLDWLGFESLTFADREVLWHFLRAANPWENYERCRAAASRNRS